MTRSERFLPSLPAVAAAVVAAAAASCDLVVHDFGGSKIDLTIANARSLPAGQHLELFARAGRDQIVRLEAAPGVAYNLVPALDLSDPCMVATDSDADRQRFAGFAPWHLLWKPESQPGATPEEKRLRAQAVEMRIHKLTDLQPAPLLAFVAWDDHAGARPVLPETASADERRRACQELWAKSPHAYTGNPYQLTSPIHGTFYGAADFTSTNAGIAGGIHLETNIALGNANELFLTQTTALPTKVDVDEIDCKKRPATCRGTLYLQGNAGSHGRGLLYFELKHPRFPDVAVSGAASVYTRLDEDPIGF